MKRILVWLIVILFIPEAAAAGSEKKLIYYGWGARDTMYVREHVQQMEQMPFDGTGITVAINREAWRQGKVDTANMLGWNVFGPKRFQLEDLTPAIADLKASRWRKFTENFLPVAISSSGQDYGFNWFDDVRWKVVLNNWGILVTIAKEGGLRGILLDPEHYGAKFFSYREMAGREKRPFKEFVVKLRERGKELMEVTRKIYPDITIFCLFAYSTVLVHVRALGDPAKALPETGYGLLPAFLDGMLEAAAPGMVLVDGDERSYGFKRKQQFERAREDVRQKAILLSSVPREYREHVQVGFGLMLDYGGRARWSTTDLSSNYFSPQALEEALRASLDTSDRYVWLYSERPQFFPPSRLPRVYLDAIRNAHP